MNKRKRTASLFAALTLTIVGLATPLASVAQGVEPNQSPRPATSLNVYVPLAVSTYPWRSIIGVEANGSVASGTRLITRTIDLGAEWIRLNERISWRAMQPTEGGPIDWSPAMNFEQEIIALNAAGVKPIVIVDDYPSWASSDPNDSCTALRPNKRTAFGDFMAALVTRYSKPPYNVKIWELGNEPDVDPIWVPANSVFGCWGIIQDLYYGGAAYGEMLKIVTPRIRAADPHAQVWIGGLLLDRELTTNPNNGRPELFLQGILEAGAAPYFDAVPYHFYPPFKNDPTIDYSAIGFDVPVGTVDTTRGGVLGKARFLRSLLSAYGVSKPLYLNETALMCVDDTENPSAYCVPPNEDFYTASSLYAIKGSLRAMSIDVKTFIWYVIDNGGWRNSGLYHVNGTPRPTYNALRTLAQMIRNTTYYSMDSGYPDTHEAFVLRRSSNEYVHVVWSKTIDDQAAISVPTAKVIAVYDMQGNTLSPAMYSGAYSLWNVGINPVYIVRRP